MSNQADQICVIIGASHAGINAAFALRKESWTGQILVFDSDKYLPYHKPPLSKTYLTNDDGVEKILLRPEVSYEQNNISLNLGVTVDSIDCEERRIKLATGAMQTYDKLILALGARPIVPAIEGLDVASHSFFLRTAEDAIKIKNAVVTSPAKRVLIIGGGYIGLETAASLKKMGASVTVLEREERILARVTAPQMSQFFQDLHSANGVSIFTGKNVQAIESRDGSSYVICSDYSEYPADVIVIGVGVRVNTELAEQAGIKIQNGILVDGLGLTSDKNVYAIGDCSYHFNPHYQRLIRLESVQNAVDQAKIVAAAICGREESYNTIPWFWSDQYDIKFQMVGLSTGYDHAVFRHELGETVKFSVWYFQGDRLLSMDAVNNAKAYVQATKLIKSGARININNLENPGVELTTDNLIA